MGIFRFDADGHIVAFEEKPKPRRLAADRPQHPGRRHFAAHSDEQPFMASMGIYVFSRRVLLDMLEHEPGHDFGRELIPKALGRYKVKPYLFRGYWADVGTIDSFYEANVMLGRPDAPFRFWDREQPIYTHLRHLPGSLIRTAASATRSSPTAAISTGATWTVGRRHADLRPAGRASRGRCCSAPTTTRTACRRPDARLGIGRDVVLDRVIVDKNARIGDGVRLVNEQIEHADGDGYFIRGGIIVVPEGRSDRAGHGGVSVNSRCKSTQLNSQSHAPWAMQA